MRKLKSPYRIAILVIGIIATVIGIELSRSNGWDSGYLYASPFPMLFASATIIGQLKSRRNDAYLAALLFGAGVVSLFATMTTANAFALGLICAAMAIIDLIYYTAPQVVLEECTRP